ncbi:hypothetical protein HPP92_015192, partial [Vanilla planifolia]
MSSSSRASPDALMEKLTICVLNTEDLDVPCNDDVSFPAKLFQTFATTNVRQNVSSTVTNDGKAAPGNSTKLPPNMTNFKAGQSMVPKVGLLQSTTDGILDPMSAERDLTSGAFGNSNVGDDDANLIPPAVSSHSASDPTLKQEATVVGSKSCTLYASAKELKERSCNANVHAITSSQLGYIDPLPTMSVSDQEEQPSDNDDDDEAPSFSDIEAMILDMDLGPYDMECSLFTKEEFHFVNSKEVPVKKRINLCTSALIEIKDMRFIFEPSLKSSVGSKNTTSSSWIFRRGLGNVPPYPPAATATFGDVDRGKRTVSNKESRCPSSDINLSVVRRYREVVQRKF